MKNRRSKIASSVLTLVKEFFSGNEFRNQPEKICVTDVPRGFTKHVQFTEDVAIQDLRERAEKILAIRESEELAEEAIRLGRMVSSNAPLY